MSQSQGSATPETPAQLAERLNLPFSNLMLLRRALTHRSYINENVDAMEDNERLEFLGDAALDFLVGAWLYKQFPEMAEGRLTRLRSALVGTDQLADFGQGLGLGGALYLGRGEEDGGGRTRKTILCAVFEAVVGALYLDAGMDAVRRWVEPLILPVTEKLLDDETDRDPKSRFQEWAQGERHGVPTYRQVSAIGPDHDRVYVYEVVIADKAYGRGAGPNKQTASKAAALDALKSLGLE